MRRRNAFIVTVMGKGRARHVFVSRVLRAFSLMSPVYSLDEEQRSSAKRRELDV